MDKKLRKIIIILGLISGLLFTILFAGMFYIAYLNNNMILITTNSFGEAIIEGFVFVPFIIMFSLYCLYLGIKDLKERKKHD